MPVSTLPGGRFRDRVDACATGFHAPDAPCPDGPIDRAPLLDAARAEAAERTAQGFRFAEVEVGLPPLADDLVRLRRAALPACAGAWQRGAMERRLTTILAADIAGYSRLMAADEEGVIARMRSARAEVIDPAIAEGGGRIVKVMGDGLLVEFASPVAAVRAALRVQDGMRAREAAEPEDRRLRFRIGVNLGDVVIDGDDVLGDAVNVAARLETLAPVGGLCIGRAVFEQARGRVAAEMTALGPQQVKNLPRPVEAWRVEVPGADAPRPEARRAERPSIAVLPFDDMSADADQEFLADGIVEDVITELSRFRSLTVIARNSTFAYRGAATDVRRIGEALGARYVVEGSVRRGGSRLRVTAQLIEAATGAHVWADRWDRTLDDLFELQDELTQAIVTAVEPELGAHERRLARARPTEALTAWEMLQRAAAAYYRFTPASIDEAIELAGRASSIDPEFASALALRARALIARSFSPDRVEGDLEAGLAAAQAGVALDPRSDETLNALGFGLSVAGRTGEAATALEQAGRLNPNNVSVRLHAAVNALHPSVARPAEALEDVQRALRLSPGDPFVWTFHFVAGIARLQLGETAEARRALDAARGFQGVDWKPFLVAALAAAADGDDAAAAAMLAEARGRYEGLNAAAMRRDLPIAFAIPSLTAAVEALMALGLPRE